MPEVLPFTTAGTSLTMPFTLASLESTRAGYAAVGVTVPDPATGVAQMRTTVVGANDKRMEGVSLSLAAGGATPLYRGPDGAFAKDLQATSTWGAAALAGLKPGTVEMTLGPADVVCIPTTWAWPSDKANSVKATRGGGCPDTRERAVPQVRRWVGVWARDVSSAGDEIGTASARSWLLRAVLDEEVGLGGAPHFAGGGDHGALDVTPDPTRCHRWAHRHGITKVRVRQRAILPLPDAHVGFDGAPVRRDGAGLGIRFELERSDRHAVGHQAGLDRDVETVASGHDLAVDLGRLRGHATVAVTTHDGDGSPLRRRAYADEAHGGAIRFAGRVHEDG